MSPMGPLSTAGAAWVAGAGCGAFSAAAARVASEAATLADADLDFAASMRAMALVMLRWRLARISAS